MSGRAPRVVGVLLALTALLGGAAGCLRLSGQPCPEGGQQCPSGYACLSGSCQPVGNDGVVATVRAVLGQGVEPASVRRVTVSTFRDDRTSCWLLRDPTDPERIATTKPDVWSELELDVDRVLRIPEGRHLMLIEAFDGHDEVVARACRVHERTPGSSYSLTVPLARANGSCGDRVRDFGEECDQGTDGNSRCSADCRSLPRVLADSSACLRDLAVDCTGSAESDGRCLVAWIADGPELDDDQLTVTVNHLDGRQDTESNRGLTTSAPELRLLRVVAEEERAAAVWVEGEAGMQGAEFNFVGQQTASFAVEGDTTTAVASLLRYVDDEGERVLRAGWVTAGGEVLVEQVSSAERWTVSLPEAPSADMSALLVGGTVVVVWSVEADLGETRSFDVVGSWVDLSTETAGEVVLISNVAEANQRQPALAYAGSGRSFFVWTDDNNGLERGDQSGESVRGRRVGSDAGEAWVQVNTTHAGDQRHPRVVSGDGVLVVTWRDEALGELRARYLDTSGRPLAHPFDDGLSTDFSVDEGGDQVGPLIAGKTEASDVFYLWLEDGEGCEIGGHQLVQRLLPPPLE